MEGFEGFTEPAIAAGRSSHHSPYQLNIPIVVLSQKSLKLSHLIPHKCASQGDALACIRRHQTFPLPVPPYLKYAPVQLNMERAPACAWATVPQRCSC
jgi:hypothetical protein